MKDPIQEVMGPGRMTEEDFAFLLHLSNHKSLFKGCYNWEFTTWFYWYSPIGAFTKIINNA